LFPSFCTQYTTARAMLRHTNRHENLTKEKKRSRVATL
jgi:hypothetical protein